MQKSMLLFFLILSMQIYADESVSASYPEKALINNIEGYLVFKFDIKPDGYVTNVKIIESVPEGVFDKYGLNAIKKWTFKPAYKNGKAVLTKNMKYKMEFKLDDDEN